MTNSCSSASSPGRWGVLLLGLLGCQSAEETFANNRIAMLCDQAYAICDVTAGCLLDQDHYIEGIFPGTHRLVVSTEEDRTTLRFLLFLSEMEGPGTELLLQIYQPACGLNTTVGRLHLSDVDLFEEAGNDRTLILDLEAEGEGEHLVELYSDAQARYLLTVEPLATD